jgi:hypothetical protein
MKQDRLASMDEQKVRRTNEESLARNKEIQLREAPRSTLDHVIDMAKRDSKFFLEGKEISSDKAIDALKKNEALNIKIVDSKSKEPKVYITKKPIQIEN